MSESYYINFTNYESDTYFNNLTATADRITFYSTDTINLKTTE